MNTSLQVLHTWVNAIMALSLLRPLQKSGMRERTSGGTRLIGASLFLQDRTKWRISKASRSRAST